MLEKMRQMLKAKLNVIFFSVNVQLQSTLQS